MALSIIGHPFLLPPVVLLAAASHAFGVAGALRGVCTLVLGCLAPASVYIGRKVQRGEWSDLDVSARKDRPRLFTVGLILLGFTTFILWATAQADVFVKGCLGAMLLLGAGWVCNRWLKPSMHVGIATLTAGAFWRAAPALAIGLLAFSLLLGWSRVVLARHTAAEVGVGMILASAVAAVVF